MRWQSQPTVRPWGASDQSYQRGFPLRQPAFSAASARFSARSARFRSNPCPASARSNCSRRTARDASRAVIARCASAGVSADTSTDVPADAGAGLSRGRARRRVSPGAYGLLNAGHRHGRCRGCPSAGASVTGWPSAWRTAGQCRAPRPARRMSSSGRRRPHPLFSARRFACGCVRRQPLGCPPTCPPTPTTGEVSSRATGPPR